MAATKAPLDDKALEDLLDSTLEEFSDETQAAGKDDASPEDSEANSAAKAKRSTESIKADVVGKFTALMAIFQADVKLDGEYQKEFQDLSDKQLTLLKAACDDGKCQTAGLAEDNGPEGDALSQAVKETVEILRSGVQQGGGPEAALSDEEVMKKFTEQLQGLDGDPAMQGVMENMMQQLLSKEFLHEPLQEIASKYPDWLEKNRDSLSEEELARYTRQQQVVQDILDVYEKTPEDVEKVVQLMQQMQQCGQPPPEIVKELGSGLEVDENGMPKMPLGAEGCCVM